MLSTNTIKHLIKTALEDSPKEMCGILCDGLTIFHYCPNSSLDPEHSFLIDQSEWDHVKHDYPWAIVHSHPGKSAAPSAQDCKLMDAFQTIGHPMQFIIVGLNPVEIRCFKKHGDLYNLEWKHVPQV